MEEKRKKITDSMREWKSNERIRERMREWTKKITIDKENERGEER